MFGSPKSGACKSKTTIETLERIRNEVDGFIEGYVNLAVESVADILSITCRGDPLAGVGGWIRCLDVQSLLQRGDLRLADKAVLRIALDTLNGRYSPQSFARALSSILLQRGIDQWQDGTVDQFRMLLRECRQRIEDAAFTVDRPNSSMAPLVRARIDVLSDMLERIENGERRLKSIDAT